MRRSTRFSASWRCCTARRTPSSPVSGVVGEGSEILRRFACELRNGAFENSPNRDARARAILWRLTIAKLRLANPKFLAANGFA